VLDPIFIYTLKLGVPGAAWASLISLCVTGCMLFYWICIKRDTYVTITMRNFRFDRHIILDILKVGLPSSMQQLSMAFSVFILNMIVVRAGGTDGIAVYTTGWRVAMFAILPVIGIATAVTSVSGAAYGGREQALSIVGIGWPNHCDARNVHQPALSRLGVVWPGIEDAIWCGRALNSRVVIVARADAKIPLTGEVFQVRRARIVGSQGHSGHGTFPNVISAMATGMDMTPMVTKQIRLDQVPEHLELLQTDRENCKITVLPD